MCEVKRKKIVCAGCVCVAAMHYQPGKIGLQFLRAVANDAKDYDEHVNSTRELSSSSNTNTHTHINIR